jgi:hypothetical protein
MSLYDRAAQFSPFAALTGYEDAIKEAGRQVSSKIEISEEEKLEINRKLNYLSEHKKDNIEFTISYFIKDKKKKGGRYEEVTSTLKRLDEVEKYILLKDDTKISIDDINEIKAEVFDSFED